MVNCSNINTLFILKEFKEFEFLKFSKKMHFMRKESLSEFTQKKTSKNKC